MDLYGLWGSSPTSAWAVGAKGTIVQWNGTSWKGSASGTTNLLDAVWGTASGPIWAAGTMGGMYTH